LKTLQVCACGVFLWFQRNKSYIDQRIGYKRMGFLYRNCSLNSWAFVRSAVGCCKQVILSARQTVINCRLLIFSAFAA